MAQFRTHYDNLQVTRSASPEVIRAAYKGLAQKWHPDRNPPERREECTRVMAILNRAYEVLSDPAQRAAHDKWIAEQEGGSVDPKAQRKTEKSTRSGPTLSEADLRGVTIWLADLTDALREELTTAVKSARPGYASAPTDTVLGSIVPVVVAIAAIWAIGFFATDERWSADGHWWALGIAFVFLYSGARGALRMITLLRERLAYKILVTPTHFIETDATAARVWPLLGVRRFHMTVHTRNGSHVGSTIDFSHACGDAATFTIKRRAEAEALHSAVLSVLTRLEETLGSYLLALQQSPLFRIGERIPTATRRPSSTGMVSAVAIAAILAVVVHWGVMLPINADAPTYRGSPPSRTTERARADSAPVTAARQPNASVSESLPEKPMPRTGWIQAPVGNSVAPLRIHAEAGTNYFMKLMEGSGTTAATMFLRAGETLDVEVPLGMYRIRFAYGSRWYGDTALFGSQTRYSELEGNLAFYNSGASVTGVEITLTKQVEGNLREHRIRPNDF